MSSSELLYFQILISIFRFYFPSDNLEEYLENEVDDLHPADEREASEEPHGASYSRQLVHKLGCSVLQRS